MTPAGVAVIRHLCVTEFVLDITDTAVLRMFYNAMYASRLVLAICVLSASCARVAASHIPLGDPVYLMSSFCLNPGLQLLFT